MFEAEYCKKGEITGDKAKIWPKWAQKLLDA